MKEVTVNRIIEVFALIASVIAAYFLGRATIQC